MLRLGRPRSHDCLELAPPKLRGQSVRLVTPQRYTDAVSRRMEGVLGGQRPAACLATKASRGVEKVPNSFRYS